MQKTILVVDYDHKSLEEIQRFFEDENFTLLTASDGTQAIEIFQAKIPDLVFTSALLPKINGFELCKKITGGELTEVRPVILFSEIYKGDKYRKEAIIGCGAVDFLEKPLIREQVLKVIRSLFQEIPTGRPGSPVNLQVSEAMPEVALASSQATVGQETSSPSDDLLEVNALLEVDQQTSSERNSSFQQEFKVPGALAHESDPQLITSKGNVETEELLDVFPLDLHLETRMRDEQIAQEIEAELFKDGYNILEFETVPGLAAENLPGHSSEELQIIELDPVSNEAGIEQISNSQPEDLRDKMPDMEQKVLNPPIPHFAVADQSPRNKIPFLVVGLVVLLVIIFYWLQGR